MTSHKSIFVNGKWQSGNGDIFFSISPETGEKVWEGSAASDSDVATACRAALKAFEGWSRTSLDERISKLRLFCKIVEARRAELTTAIGNEIGKPRWEAETEVRAVIGKLEPSIEALAVRCSEFRPTNGAGAVTRFVPVGPAAVISPYNFPIHMANVHIMPALLAGNTVVWKQSELAPHCGELIASCWQEANLPEGTINLLQGDGKVGASLCRQDAIRGIYFTGGELVGNRIASDAAGRGKLLVLEMGGNTPIVVWDAANIDAAVFTVIQSCFITSGQRCSSARRLIVRTGQFGDEFLKRLCEVASRLKVGPPQAEPQPYMGPLVTKAASARVLEFQRSLLARGGRGLLCAKQLENGPNFVSPGIIDVTDIIQPLDEEVLGPVVTVRRMPSFEDALAEANRSRFGLAAGLISADRNLYERFRLAVEVGVVSWNAATTGNSARAAFGGVKASGNYRPTGFYSCDYTTRAVGGIENDEVTVPSNLPPGLSL